MSAHTATAHPLNRPPQGEMGVAHPAHPLVENPALRAQATRAREHPYLTAVGAVALLAVLVGLLVLTYAPGEWLRAGGATAAGILTLCVVASIWEGEQR